MTFQQNARNTFYWRHFSKTASVVALAVTFGTSFAVVGVPEQSLALAYVFLLNMVVLVIVVFFMTTKPPVNLLAERQPWYQLRELWKPLVLGLIVVLSVYIGVLLMFGFPLGQNSLGQNVHDVLLFAIFVGFVEEFMRWTWVQTLPYGILSANLLWVLLHPEVAPILNGQAWNPFFAAFALIFGLGVATPAMWFYETPMPYGVNRYLGVIFAATVHAGYNALTIMWKVQVVVPGSGQTSFGPMYAPAVVLAGVLTITLYAIAMTRRKIGRPSGGERTRATRR